MLKQEKTVKGGIHARRLLAFWLGRSLPAQGSIRLKCNYPILIVLGFFGSSPRQFLENLIPKEPIMLYNN